MMTVPLHEFVCRHCREKTPLYLCNTARFNWYLSRSSERYQQKPPENSRRGCVNKSHFYFSIRVNTKRTKAEDKKTGNLATSQRRQTHTHRFQLQLFHFTMKTKTFEWYDKRAFKFQWKRTKLKGQKWFFKKLREIFLFLRSNGIKNAAGILVLKKLPIHKFNYHGNIIFFSFVVFTNGTPDTTGSADKWLILSPTYVTDSEQRNL